MPGKQLTLAKLSRPRLHDVLPRARLFGVLDRAVRRPVVWLAAQPGAGKTTLVASYLQARKRAGIWYQCDAADADPASFVYHLRLAAQSLPAARTQGDLPLLTPEYLQDLPGFARRFCRELFARLESATLVFDNFQEVPDDASFHRFMLAALTEIPTGVNAIVLSRIEPAAAYAPLLAGDVIAPIDGEQLRLTLNETEGIARKRGLDETAAIQWLQDRSHGWAAGLTLLLTGARAQPEQWVDDVESLQHVFGYFAQRVFDAAAPEHRRALMQLAFLPLITVDLAERLTGMDDVGQLLDQYHRRHLFTERRRVATDAGAVQPASARSGHVFQFHALFKAFLQHQARAAFGAAEVREVFGRAGQLLDAAGQWEQALALLAEAGDWASYARAIVSHAEILLGQGRQQSLTDWLARLPETLRQNDPWLAYWEGRALMHTAPERAMHVLQASHRRFAVDDDVAGQLASAAAIVQTLWYARLGWSEIMPWVDQIEPLMAHDVCFPSPAVELLTFSALHAALAFCRLSHPELMGMARRLLGLIDDGGIDWNQRLSTATHLMAWFHNAAEFDLASQLIAKVDPVIDARPSSASNRAYWFIFRAIHDMRQARSGEASERYQRAEDLARQDGLVHAEFAALQFHTYLDLLFRRVDRARTRLARMETHPARGHADAEMHFYTLQAMLAQQQSRSADSLAHAQRALQAIERVGAAYFQAVYPASLASVLADAGQGDRALAILTNSRAVVRGSYLEVIEAQLLLEEAYVALTRHDQTAALAKLARGLTLAVADRSCAAYLHRIAARKPVLLELALKAGIEIEHVRQLIRRWRVPPPADELASWPWPVKVRTLGGFDLRVHDEPIAFGRKAPKKTLALLKAVIARGGTAPDGALIDLFWPDEDGDAAARSLAAAVQRLRALLGLADAVVQQGGQVSLERDLVWVDAWAFEHALSALRNAGDARATTAEALALYRGAFLVEEEGEAWPVAMRERLRTKFIQAVADHGARLEAAHRDEQAIAWYLRGLDADNVVEPFYQGLMRCYHRLDRLPEAVSAYRRLKQTLSVTLSLPPSVGTEKLYRNLRLG